MGGGYVPIIVYEGEEMNDTEHRTQKNCEELKNNVKRVTNKIDFLGNIYGLHDGYDGSVFSVYGICPTITVCGSRCVIDNE